MFGVEYRKRVDKNNVFLRSNADFAYFSRPKLDFGWFPRGRGSQNLKSSSFLYKVVQNLLLF